MTKVTGHDIPLACASLLTVAEEISHGGLYKSRSFEIKNAGLGVLKKSASDPTEKRQKKCLLEPRTKIGLTDKNSGTNGQFLFRLGNFFVRLGPLFCPLVHFFCPLSHFFAAFLVEPIWQKSGNFFSGALI